MARFAKTVLEVGTHQSPEGPVVVTPERIRRWADQHSQMRALGIKTPVPWGHQRSAFPQYAGEQQYLAAKLNAGYFDRLEASADGRQLRAVIDAPGVDVENGNLVTLAELPGGPKVKAAISEVSAAITKKFKDGKGRVWDDVITHVAITPLPVWAGQEGFQSLSLESETVTLSLGATGWTLATGGNMGPDEDDDLEVDAGAPPPVEPPLPMEPPPPAGGGDQSFFQAKSLLGEHGIVLPDSTTPENGWQHLAVALTALKGKLTPKGDDGNPDIAEPGDENAPVIAENSPAMLSLQRDNPAAANALKKMSEREQTRVQNRLAKKMERARKVLPADEMARLDNMGTVHLSLMGSGEMREPKEFTRSEVLDLVLAARPAAALTRTLSAATEHPSPIPSPTKQAEEREKIIDEMAVMAGVPAKKP